MIADQIMKGWIRSILQDLTESETNDLTRFGGAVLDWAT